MSNTSVTLSSTFKSFILISNFATFWPFKKFDVNTRMWSQNAERFKRIIQQTFKKLNFERSRVDSSSDQFMKNRKKTIILMILKTRLSVRNDYSNWLLDIVTIIYNDQETIINWRRNVCHEMNFAFFMLFLLFLYWINVSFRSFIYTSVFIIFRFQLFFHHLIRSNTFAFLMHTA